MPRSLTWLVLAALAVLVLLGGGTSVLAKARELPDAVGTDEASGGQSASQISSTEYTEAAPGISTDALRALLGEPEAKEEHEVEGLRLACWYYGAGSTTGAYQFCFQNGRLRAKFSYP